MELKYSQKSTVRDRGFLGGNSTYKANWDFRELAQFLSREAHKWLRGKSPQIESNRSNKANIVHPRFVGKKSGYK